jgi:acetyl esterase/lipase
MKNKKRVVIVIIVAVLVCSAAIPLFSVWSGHIPEKYAYNAELPPASSVMAWTNIESPVVQNALKKTIQQEIENLAIYEAPAGFNVTWYPVPVKDGIIKMYCIEPDNIADEKNVPVVLYIHGGAFYFPLTDEALNSMAYYAKALSARVFLPDYRTSMDNPFPIPLEDCYASVLYLEDNAENLGIDISRLIIYGDSAGGALAAGTTQYIRDIRDYSSGLKICGQILVYPVLDNAMNYESMQKYKDAPWPLNANKNMWEIYLKNGDSGQVKYAAPMQSNDFSNLPQAYIETCEMDILCDEGLAYAQKLKEAGVKVETYVVPGGYHGYDSDQTNSFVQKMLLKSVMIMQNMLY